MRIKTATPVPLALHNVSKRYGAHGALDEVSLELPAQTTALIGPSGCGKSTLLRTLIGLVTPDSGQLFFEGRPIDAADIGALRQRMGYVIQEGGLFPHLKARANVTLMARYLGRDKAETAARCDELAELVDLTPDQLDRYPGELSGGQRQRVSLMRALMLDPKVLLLDEPLGALDPMIRAQLQEELKRIFNRLGKTVVIVTHDLAEAAFFGHQIVLMRDGQVEQIGALKELEANPANAFVEEFIAVQRRAIAAAVGA